MSGRRLKSINFAASSEKGEEAQIEITTLQVQEIGILIHKGMVDCFLLLLNRRLTLVRELLLFLREY